MLGTHNVYAALAAATVGYVLGLTANEIARGLAGQQERLRLTTAPGPNGATLIDDTYNSSPQSAIAALDLLASLDAPRRVAVLADMFELGDYSAEAHEIVGTHAAKTADVLIHLRAALRWRRRRRRAWRGCLLMQSSASRWTIKTRSPRACGRNSRRAISYS